MIGIRPSRIFRELEEMERRLDETFGRASWPRLMAEGERGWAPAMDVYEKDDKFIVKAEIPGMKAEDIDVSVVDGALEIKGEKKAESEVKEENYYRSERCYGAFFRSMPLPANVDSKKIVAHYEDGILEVTIPKAPGAKGEKIQIQTKKVARQS